MLLWIRKNNGQTRSKMYNAQENGEYSEVMHRLCVRLRNAQIDSENT